MSNLIPTPRTDKNGRTITRHMKADNTAAPVGKIPPVTTQPSTRSQYLTSAAKVLRDAITNGSYLLSVDRCLNSAEPVLATLSNATLERIHNHPWSTRAAENFAMRLGEGWDETMANDCMATSAALDLTNEYGMDSMHLFAWRYLYPELCPSNNDGDYPEERLSQLVALHRIVTYMEEKTTLQPYFTDEATGEIKGLYINDAELREFVLYPQAPYTREAITEMVVTNGTFDVARIKAMIDSNSPSLSSGVL